MKRLNSITTYADERFIAQVGIISIQNRIDPDSPLNRRWTSQFKVHGISYHIEGYAADFGRPRGVDTDVQLAVETLFLLQGCPQDNTVHTSAYELLQMSHMSQKGTNYARLRESLMRLWRVGFLVSKAHYLPGSPWGTYMNETLGLFQRVRFWSKGKQDKSPNLQSLVADGKLTIQLSEPLAHSIRAGYTQSLDRRLLAQLEQPAGRATYRILQAHRTGEGPFQVGLLDWGVACGIITTEPDKIRRTLQAAHEELQNANYLEGVERIGRGSKQLVEYHFRKEGSADPALVQLLIEQGIRRPRAEVLAKKHPERVETAIQYVVSRRAGGNVKNPGGYIADILSNADKYDLEAQPGLPKSPAFPPMDPARFEREAAREHEHQQQILLSLPPERQWEECKQGLRFLLGKAINAEQFAALEALCTAGHVDATALRRELPMVPTAERRIRVEALLEDMAPLL